MKDNSQLTLQVAGDENGITAFQMDIKVVACPKSIIDNLIFTSHTYPVLCLVGSSLVLGLLIDPK